MPPTKVLSQVPEGYEIMDFDEVDLSREVVWFRVKKKNKVTRICVKLQAVTR